MREIPYKIYLEEHEMPKQWYNVRADMKKKPAPLLNPQTMQPITAEGRPWDPVPADPAPAGTARSYSHSPEFVRPACICT